MSQFIDIAIIFPVFNPQNGSEIKIKDVFDIIPAAFPEKSFQFVVVDDGSTHDFNFDFQKNYECITLITHPSNKGKGAAIRSGIRSINANYYIYTDFDIPFGVPSLVQVIKKFEEKNADTILSVRNDNYFTILPLQRKIISKILIFMNYILFDGKIKDTQGGLKGYNKKTAEIVLKGKQNGFLFEIESLLEMQKQNVKFDFIEVNPSHDLKISNIRINVLMENFINLIKLIIRKDQK